MSHSTQYWLFKSEPDAFSIQHLALAPKQTTHWEGVRNYQARNFLRDRIQIGDRVLFYHSNAQPSAVVGTAVVVRAGYADHSAQDPKSKYYDPKATSSNPIWYVVDIRLEEIFPRHLTLEELRGASELKDMELLRKGSRLSVQPVEQHHFDLITRLAHASAPKEILFSGKQIAIKKKTSRTAKKKSVHRKTSR